MAQQIFGNPATVLKTLEAFFGVAPSNAVYSNNLSFVETNGAPAYARTIASNFVGVSNAALASSVLGNLGISATTTNPVAFPALLDALTQAFNAFPTERGQVVLNLVNILSTLEGNATYGGVALTFNDTITASAAYSTNPANTVSFDVKPSLDRSFTLTAGVDNFIGGAGNDTFLTTSASFQSFDSLNGGAGNDVLSITNNAGVSDGQFQNVRSVETLTAVNNLDLGTLASAAGLNSVILGGTGQNVNLTGFATALTVTGNTTAEAVTIDMRDAGAKSLNLGAGSLFDNITVNGATNQVRVSFTSAEVGNGSGNDASATTPQDAGLAVRLQEENAAGDLPAGGVVHRVDDEGTRLTGASFDVRDLVSGDARGVFSEVVLGTSGADSLSASGASAVYINAGAGNDTLSGTANADFLVGGSGDDTINTATGNDSVLGGVGNDGITAGTGVVSLNGGDGNDTFTVSGLTTNLAAGTSDTIVGGLGTDTLVAASADLTAILAPVLPAVATISGIESLTVSDALAGDLVLANVQAGIDTLTLNGLAGAARTVTADGGSRAINLAVALGQQLNVVSAGTGTSDVVTLSNTAAATNVFDGRVLTATGVETLALIGTGTGVATTQTTGAITGTAGSTAVVFSGSNSFSVGAVTGGSINASALSGTAVLTQTAAAVGVTSITGSVGGDTLIGQAALATTINGGAGNDTITGGTANDVLNGGAGNDTIVTSAGADTIDGGDDNDTVIAASAADLLGDVVTGGNGIDTLQIGSTVSALQVATVSGFEVLALAANQDMVQFVANPGFNRINYNAAGNIAVTSGSANIATLGLIGNGANTHSFSRLVDTANNAITLVNDSGAAQGPINLTINDEEAVTVNAASNVDFTALSASDLTSLTLTGAGNITADLVGTSALASVNASAATGAIDIDAAASNVNLTFVGAVATTNVFVSGAGADNLTGGTAADNLAGGNGADILNGGGGNDILSGGVGADDITTGSGNDSVVYALGDAGVVGFAQAAGAVNNALNPVQGNTYTGTEVVRDLVTGDTLNLGNAAAVADVDGVLANNEYLIVQGTYAGGVFTVGANGNTGADSLLIYDADASGAFAQADIVLVGVSNAEEAAIVNTAGVLSVFGA